MPFTSLLIAAATLAARPGALAHDDDRGSADSSTITALAFTAAGDFVLAGTANGHLQYLRVPTGEIVASIGLHTSEVKAVAASTKDGRIATAGADGHIRVIAPDQDLPFLQIAQDVVALGFSRDGRTLRAIDDAGDIFNFDSANGALRRRLPCPDSRKTAGGFVFGDLIVQAYEDGWNDDFGLVQADEGSKFFEVAGGMSARGPDSFHVVAGSAKMVAYRPIFVGNSVTLFDLATRQPRAQTPASEGLIRAAAFSSDGDRLVTVTTTGQLRVWDPANVRDLGTHQVGSPITALAVDSKCAHAAVIVAGDVSIVTLDSDAKMPSDEPTASPATEKDG